MVEEKPVTDEDLTSESNMTKEVSEMNNTEEGEEVVETIEQLAKLITIRKPRPLIQQILVSLGFVLGPLMLLLDLIFPSLFSFLPFSGLYIFIPITVLFFLASIISAKRYS